MTVKVEQNRLGDLLKYEQDNQFSRDEVTIAAGQELRLGTVVSKVTASGEITAFNPTATDGSEIPYGVLANDVDSTEGATLSWIIRRHAVVHNKVLIWPDGITEEQLTTAITQLDQINILVREGA